MPGNLIWTWIFLLFKNSIITNFRDFRNFLKQNYKSKCQITSFYLESNLSSTLVCREKFEICREIILRKSNFEVFPKICPIKSFSHVLSRLMRKRLQQHRTDANAVRKQGRNTEKTALTQHMAKTGHTFDFQNATILSRNNSARRLNYLEMFCIRANNCCNLRTDVSKLSVAYSGLINQVKDLNKNLPCIHKDD
jgi:hypothetical protein